ncbi:MAG: hypothetical protein ABI551_24490 [Polyangiaceae bacterium]
MSDAPTSLRHPDSPKGDDAALAAESKAHVAGSPALQLIAELVTKLRNSRFSWWTPESLRDAWSSNERMRWFEQRPDIRQRITCGLTGLAPRASRNKQPDFQAALVDSVVDDGDVTADEFENAFDPVELAAYAPVGEIWHRFREKMPWDQDTPAHQELVGWLFDQLLSSSSTIEGMTRKPILSSHQVRTTIPGKIWHSKIPMEVRVAIDDLRFQRERAKPGEPFHSIHDLSVATPTIIAANIPLRELVRVVEVAEKTLGIPAKGQSAGTSLAKPVDETKAEAAKDKEPEKAAPPVDAKPADAKAATDKAGAEKATAEKAAADKVAADKVANDKQGPKSAIERMAEKVIEKVVEKVAPKDLTPKAPPTGGFGALPQTGKLNVVLPGTPIGTPVGSPLPNPGGEPITARGPKDEAPGSDRGDDIIVETDDSFKFDDDEEASDAASKNAPPPPPAKR